MKTMVMTMTSAALLTLAGSVSVSAAPAPAKMPAATARTATASRTPAPSRAATAARQGARVTPRGAATTRQIIRAINRDESTSAVPASAYTVVGLRFSRVDASWARAELKPKRGVQLDTATVLVHRTRGAWKVADLGTAEVGCGTAPKRVLASLGLSCS